MNTRKIAPKYQTSLDARCPECKKLCQIVPLKNEFDYAGTHCTGGRPGTHYPKTYGQAVSDCCHAPMEID